MALDLGKQIGPLPLGAWLAVVAGGLGIAAYSRNAGAADSPTIVDDTGTPDGVADGTVGGWTPTSPAPTTDTGDGGLPDTITDNDAWGNRSINWLIAQGYEPAWSYSAITKALAGGRGENRLSVREYALWRAALRKWGAPPYPVVIPPPSAVPTRRPHKTPGTKPKPRDPGPRPGPKPVPGPATYRYATVKPAPLPGSTLKSLAQIYYHDPHKWHRIYEANRAGQRRADGTPGLIHDPNKLHVGWRLLIPRG